MKSLLSYLLLVLSAHVFLQAGDNIKQQYKTITTLDDNGDASKTIPEMVQSFGLNFETHKIKTKDGYILTAWRMYKHSKENKVPIILQHGILDDGFSFLVLGRRNSLVTYLAKKGYDVWIGNSRGQAYSMDHEEYYHSYNPFSKYWDFSFHEMAIYDFPAIISYVKNITSSNKVNFIGHSQGATQYFIKATLDPEFINENINTFIGIGPAVFVNPQGAFLVEKIAHTIPIFDYMYSLGLGYFWVLPDNIRALTETFCRNNPSVFQTIIDPIAGQTSRNKFDLTRWPSFCTKMPGGTSTKNLIHWMQIIRSGGKFQMFDYGESKNQQIYNQDTPPLYNIENLKKISVPTLILYGTKDALITQDSVQKLLKLLNKDENFEKMEIDDYSHMDFLWAKDAIKDVFPHMDRFVKRIIRKQI